MWPKMLFELLPHVGRLIPAAERFLQTRGQQDAQEQAALKEIAQTLRTEMERATEAHAGVARALGEQAQQVSAMSVEVTRVRVGIELVEARVAKLEGGYAAAGEAAARAEQSAAKLKGMFTAVLVLLAGIAVLLLVVVVRVWGR
jgi:chromosome segregation ATPase